MHDSDFDTDTRIHRHTDTRIGYGDLRCIATSATVESAGDVSVTEAVADFALRLFGELGKFP